MSETDSCGLHELLAAARVGDRRAFAELVRLHQRLVYSLALRMLQHREAAEDLSQEVFLQLHGKLATIESPAHLTFWLRKVVAHRAIDRLRREPMFELTTIDEALSVAAISDADPMLGRELRRHLLTLAPAARAVVILRYQEDLDPTEIAAALDMSINTVKSHLKRSLAVLRLKMGAADSPAEEVAR